jgi:nucleotide-binding universal stress UspA family protein
MKILLASDGSQCSNTAAESVAKRPWESGSELKIVSVIEPFQPYSTDIYTLSNEFWDKMRAASQEQAEAAIQKAKSYFTGVDSSLIVHTKILTGNPRNTILDEAEEWGADLIVVGSHGYTGLKRVLIGSVSLAIASHAHCSVEIVRSRKNKQ